MREQKGRGKRNIQYNIYATNTARGARMRLRDVPNEVPMGPLGGRHGSEQRVGWFGSRRAAWPRQKGPVPSTEDEIIQIEERLVHRYNTHMHDEWLLVGPFL